MNRVYIFFLLYIATGLASCKKTDLEMELDKLPIATEEGRGTFGCLINGKAFLPDNGCYFFLCKGPMKNWYVERTGELHIDVEFSRPESYQHISITIKQCFAAGIFEVSNSPSNNVSISYRANMDSKPECRDFYSSDTTTTRLGFVRITKIDKVNRITSGFFEFNLQKSGCDEIKVTNGRFDLKYWP